MIGKNTLLLEFLELIVKLKALFIILLPIMHDVSPPPSVPFHCFGPHTYLGIFLLPTANSCGSF